jgi:hypothetical protein
VPAARALVPANGEGASRAAVAALVEALLPWACHHSHHVRSLAALAIRSHMAAHPSAAAPFPAAVLGFMEANEEVAALHARLEALFFADLDLATLSDHRRVLAPAVGAGDAMGEQIPPALVELVEAEMHDCHRALAAAAAHRAAAAAAGAPGRAQHGGGADGPGEAGAVRAGLLQRKYQPAAGGEGQDEGSARAGDAVGASDPDSWRGKGEARRPCALVVVASLVDKMPNLAGLARTCEIFQATSLCVADRARTFADPVFKQVAALAPRPP